MKGKYKNRSRITLSRALETCPSWAGQELVQLAVGCQAPKEQGLRGWEGRRKGAQPAARSPAGIRNCCCLMVGEGKRIQVAISRLGPEPTWMFVSQYHSFQFQGQDHPGSQRATCGRMTKEEAAQTCIPQPSWNERALLDTSYPGQFFTSTL